MWASEEFEIGALLRMALQRNAAEIYLTGGQPPVIRAGGHMVRLMSRRLTDSDCVRFMEGITPQTSQRELAEKLGTTFEFAFGSVARFRTAVFRQRRQIGLVIRRISADPMPAC